MKPKYLQIAETLEQQIHDGVLKPKAMLPKESILQEQFSVSRVTIRKSLQILVDKNLITRSRGSGTFITPPKAQHDALELLGFIEEVSKQGKKPSSKVIKFELKNADSVISDKLNLPINSEIYEVHRIRLIDDIPEIYEITYMPMSLFPELSVSVMQNSKYEYIENDKKLKISKSHQIVTPHTINGELAKYLDEPEDTAILKVSCTGYLESGIAFEHSIHYFRLHQYQFEFISARK